MVSKIWLRVYIIVSFIKIVYYRICLIISHIKLSYYLLMIKISNKPNKIKIYKNVKKHKRINTILYYLHSIFSIIKTKKNNNSDPLFI